MRKKIEILTDLVKSEADFRRKLIELIIERNKAIDKALEELEK